jgi:hypothetical protein
MLRRLYVLFLLDVSNRHLHVLGVHLMFMRSSFQNGHGSIARRAVWKAGESCGAAVDQGR